MVDRPPRRASADGVTPRGEGGRSHVEWFSAPAEQRPQPPNGVNGAPGPSGNGHPVLDTERTQPVARQQAAPPAPRPVGDEPTVIIPRVRGTASRHPVTEPPWSEEPDAAAAGSDGDGEEDRPGRHGKHRSRPRKQPLWREVLVLIGVALLLTFLIQHFLGRVYSIPSGSMEQTLHGCPGCTADRVMVDKVIYDFRDPAPGDVIVFEGPNSWTENDVVPPDTGNAVVRGLQYVGSLIGIAPPDERDFVKRVVAVGGQTVQCCDEQGRVQVDGKSLDEPYIYWENGGPDERQRFDEVTVPEGTLWVMGDNRANSSDSRFQGGGGIRGVVPLGKVIGKARYIVLPPSRWQGVGDHDPQAGAAQALSAPGWQQNIPATAGFAAAWPVLWGVRRLRRALLGPRGSTVTGDQPFLGKAG